MTSSRARAARRRPNETSFPDGTCPDDRSRPSRDAKTVNTSPSAQGARRGHNFAASAHDLLAEHQPLGQPLRSAILRSRT